MSEYTQTLFWDRPKSKARPRVTKTGHAYTEKATVDAERNLASQYEGPKFEGHVTFEADFYNDHINIRITDCEAPVERKVIGDTDNYLKLVTDALNGIAYTDDRQIATVVGRKK